MKTIEYKGFDGHIILLCKNHYGKDMKISIIEALKMLWSIRCGYNYDKDDNSCIKSITDILYKILYPTITNHITFQENLHDYLLSWIHNDLSSYERLIYFYVSEMANMQVKEKLPNGKWTTLVKLPKLKKQLFNRILRGNGKYEDYKLIDQ